MRSCQFFCARNPWDIGVEIIGKYLQEEVAKPWSRGKTNSGNGGFARVPLPLGLLESWT
jgi:hypothetical protein